MDKSQKLLLLDKEDIQEGTNISNLGIDKLKSKSFTTCDVSILKLASGETVVLKNRTGIEGVVVPRGVYNDFLKWLNENNKSDSAPKKKSLMARLFEGAFWARS